MELESTRVFVKVVQNESFSRAARALGVPTSTVSRVIQRLEREVGTKLLLRTTRTLTLTPAGRAFFDRAVGPVLALEDARRSVQGTDDALTGLVKITATEDQGALVVTPVVGRLMRLYPGLTFKLEYRTDVVDLVKEGFDLALRIGRLNPSRFKSLRLGEIPLVAVAAPEYLAGRERIRHPSDLARHACLTLASERTRLTFHAKAGRAKVALAPHLTATQMQPLVELAVAGAGVALVPPSVCRRHLGDSSLTRVLPEWTTSSYEVHLVSPNQAGMPARVRLVAEEIARTAKALLAP